MNRSVCLVPRIEVAALRLLLAPTQMAVPPLLVSLLAQPLETYDLMISGPCDLLVHLPGLTVPGPACLSILAPPSLRSSTRWVLAIVCVTLPDYVSSR